MSRTSRRVSALLLAVAAAVALTGCVQRPPGSATPPPEPCPSTPDVIQFNGDSLGIAVPRFMRVADRIVVGRAQARSGFTYELPAEPDKGYAPVPTIGRQIQSWIELCGVPGLLIIEGGVNDIAGRTASAEAVQAAVTELSDWLEEREVPTIWLPVHPLPTAGTYMWSQPVRQAYNAWLQAGHVWGSVVNCNPVLEDPAHPDTMSPAFYSVVDLWGHVDGVHPNVAGYRAWADCISARVPPLPAAG